MHRRRPCACSQIHKESQLAWMPFLSQIASRKYQRVHADSTRVVMITHPPGCSPLVRCEHFWLCTQAQHSTVQHACTSACVVMIATVTISCVLVLISSMCWNCVIMTSEQSECKCRPELRWMSEVPYSMLLAISYTPQSKHRHALCCRHNLQSKIAHHMQQGFCAFS